MEETRKPIKGYEGKYEISNLGNVKSLERKTGYGIMGHSYKERILKQHTNKDGDKYVILSRYGSRKKYFIK